MLLLALAALLAGCGETFRPVAIPLPQPGGDPTAVRNALVLAANGSSQGTITQINVSGDTLSAVHTVGVNPVAATLASGSLRVITANRDDSSLTSYVIFQGSTAPTTTISLPPNSCPVSITSTDSTHAYVANSLCGAGGPGNVGVISLTNLALSQSVQTGVNPVSVVQLPSGAKVYVANQGDNSVTGINSSDGSSFTITAGIGSSPSYVTASSDSACVYVANQGDGTVSVISTEAGDTVQTPAISVGAGPSFLYFDPKLNRVYVVNTAGNSLSVISHSVDPTNICRPTLLNASPIPVGSQPRSVVALADGTRAYVANSASNSVTVVDAGSLTVRKTIDLTTVPAGSTPGLNPVSIAAASDSSRVYTANHDSGNVSVLNTGNDTVFLTLKSASPSPNVVLVTP